MLPPDHTALQRHTLQVLFGGTVAARAGTSLAFTVAALAVKDMVGSAWAGLAMVAATLGAAISASWLSSLMFRRGRNPGLTAGFAAAAVGGVVSVAAIEGGAVVVFLLALVLVGAASGAAGLARYGAADLATPERRSRDISIIVFASTVGAVGGPVLVGPAGRLAEAWGLDELSGPMLAGAALFAVGALVIAIWLRPDPLVVADGLQEPGAGTPGFTAGLRCAWTRVDARLALLSMVTSHAVMVMVMAMTPLHMDAHDHDVSGIGWVISVHTAGMYALAPLAGWVSDRAGRVPALAIGATTLFAATIVTALAVDAPNTLMFPGLFLLGLGWSFAVVAGSALLTESVPTAERVAVQGSTDVAMNVAGGAGALAAGLIFSTGGYHVLSLLGTVASLVLAVFALGRARAPERDGDRPDVPAGGAPVGDAPAGNERS